MLVVLLVAVLVLLMQLIRLAEMRLFLLADDTLEFLLAQVLFCWQKC